METQKYRTSRKVAIAVWSVLYRAFVILFGIRLIQWDWSAPAGPGACYNTTLIATPSSSHPYVDRIYLGITSFYMDTVLIVTTFKKGDEKHRGYPVNDPGQLLLFTFAQYFVHVYSVFALRASNQHLLTGDSENSWGLDRSLHL
jgi:hypothetical protein